MLANDAASRLALRPLHRRPVISRLAAMDEAAAPFRIEQIVSGGQTGVDRAALDAAIEMGIAHGGYCPRGRRAEDGPIDLRYALVEIDSPQYHVRTERNVAESDGTLVLCRGVPSGGTKLTVSLARRYDRPHRVVDLGAAEDAAEVIEWLARQEIRKLNVAGPRESQSPGIYAVARHWLETLLSGL